MKTTEGKTETITIRITEELKKDIEEIAQKERRTPAGLVALWVEDVAKVEKIKPTTAPQYGRY